MAASSIGTSCAEEVASEPHTKPATNTDHAVARSIRPNMPRSLDNNRPPRLEKKNCVKGNSLVRGRFAFHKDHNQKPTYILVENPLISSTQTCRRRSNLEFPRPVPLGKPTPQTKRTSLTNKPKVGTKLAHGILPGTTPTTNKELPSWSDKPH